MQQRVVGNQTGRQAGRQGSDDGNHRQTETQTARQSDFRINTRALRVAQEDILFFDVKPCDLAAV